MEFLSGSKLPVARSAGHSATLLARPVSAAGWRA